MTNRRQLMPYVRDVGSDAVRLPRDTERRLSAYIGRPVRVRNTADLARAYTDLMRRGLADRLRKMLQDAEHRAMSRKGDGAE